MQCFLIKELDLQNKSIAETFLPTLLNSPFVAEHLKRTKMDDINYLVSHKIIDDSINPFSQKEEFMKLSNKKKQLKKPKIS